jgi:hypothetical protein
MMERAPAGGNCHSGYFVLQRSISFLSYPVLLFDHYSYWAKENLQVSSYICIYLAVQFEEKNTFSEPSRNTYLDEENLQLPRKICFLDMLQ